MTVALAEEASSIFSHSVRVNWNNQSVPWWNECCAMVLEVFGLPGNRFMYRPHERSEEHTSGTPVT